jgi:hypothetical protein
MKEVMLVIIWPWRTPMALMNFLPKAPLPMVYPMRQPVMA